MASPSAPAFAALTDLASEKLGGQVLFATDEWFAPACSLIKLTEPVSQFGVFTEQGQWMDGWESARKRVAGHDWCILRLGASGTIQGLEVDTAFFTGNFAPRISIQAACDIKEPRRLTKWKSEAGRRASDKDFRAVAALKSEDWEVVLPMTNLRSGVPATRTHFFEVLSRKRYTHLRVNIFPDGGVARLRVYGRVFPDWARVGRAELDFCSATNGALAIGWSDTHYGHPKNMLTLGRGVNMGDGWETRRQSNRPAELLENSEGNIAFPDDVNDWVIIQLGTAMVPSRVEIDTIHFKGNYPESFLLEGCIAEPQEAGPAGLSKPACDGLGAWQRLLPRTKLGPHRLATFPTTSTAPVTHVRLTIFPDGGVSRIRLFGKQARTASKL